jgi:hypothetical protein
MMTMTSIDNYCLFVSESQCLTPEKYRRNACDEQSEETRRDDGDEGRIQI